MHIPEPVNDYYTLARFRACSEPEQIAFTFLKDGEKEESHLRHGELDAQARLIAARLQELVHAERDSVNAPRVLLLFDPGLDYIAAFFGAIYAGMIPVPAYPPDLMRADRMLPRLQTLAADCQASVILGTRSSLGLVRGLLEQAQKGDAPILCAIDKRDSWRDQSWTEPVIRPESIAFLQYTSGSTTTPRGVMVTHANLIYQASLLNRRWSEAYPHTGQMGVVGVSWLPLYHDLGLIGGILAPFYAGRRMVLMSPLAFIQSPIRWLQAISHYRAIATGGPNFAFDLCVSKFRAEDAVGLDLSCLRIVLNGAEPIRGETLHRFTETFSRYGFDPASWLPSYGLAEATLGVTGFEHGMCCPQYDFSLEALEVHHARLASTPGERVRRLVGCGQALTDTEVRIVDPHSRRELGADEVGEVWIRGPGVTPGYWNRPEENEAVFNARIAPSNEGPFLRTGDLGFLHDAILYLTGRLKETMIFWGRNVYPQDIEFTVAGCHDSLRLNGGAAFACEKEDRELLVVVQEVLRPGRLDLAKICFSVRQAVMAEHRVPLDALVLIRAGTLPKTSSGKIQRNETRRKYLAGELDVIHVSRLENEQGSGNDNPLPSVQAIQDWLRQRIAQAIGTTEEQIGVNEPLGHYVIDSITVVAVARDLELWLGRNIDPAILFDSPTLECLARRLTNPTYHQAEAKPAQRVDELSEGEVDQALARLLGESSTPILPSKEGVI